MLLKATSWPRSSSTLAVRHQSSSLPPQGMPAIVEKKAIRIVRLPGQAAFAERYRGASDRSLELVSIETSPATQRIGRSKLSKRFTFTPSVHLAGREGSEGCHK